MREQLEARYPGQVTSTIVPPSDDRIVHVADQRHGSGIVFDQRGFPILDAVAVYDTKLELLAPKVVWRTKSCED